MTQAALATKLVKVGKALGWIEKRGTAPDVIGGFKFVAASDLFFAVRSKLHDEGIAFTLDIDHPIDIIQFANNQGKTTFLATVTGTGCFYDGETGAVITARGAGQGSDASDKAVPKAITGLLKSWFVANLLLPSTDDAEASDASGQTVGRTTQPANSNAPRPSNATGPKPPPAQRTGLTVAQVKLMKATMKEAGLETQVEMHAFAFLVVGKNKSIEMNDADLDRILTALREDTQAVENAKTVV